MPILEWTECYSVHSVPDSRMDGIVFWRESCASAPVSFDHVSYSVFGIVRDLFYWELIFCVFCYSYSEIGINGIVPKERAHSAQPLPQFGESWRHYMRHSCCDVTCCSTSSRLSFSGEGEGELVREVLPCAQGCFSPDARSEYSTTAMTYTISVIQNTIRHSSCFWKNNISVNFCIAAWCSQVFLFFVVGGVVYLFVFFCASQRPGVAFETSIALRFSSIEPLTTSSSWFYSVNDGASRRDLTLHDFAKIRLLQGSKKNLSFGQHFRSTCLKLFWLSPTGSVNGQKCHENFQPRLPVGQVTNGICLPERKIY